MRSLLFGCLVLGTVGCSVDVGNLFGNDGSGGNGTGGAGSQQASNATSDVATSTTDGSTTTATSTSVTTGGQTTTAATTGTGMTTGPTVFCGGAECDPNQVCCFNRFVENVDFCSAAGTCPDGGEWTEISCNGPADCGTGECCGTYDQNQGWVKIQCAQNCGGNDLTMCFGDPTVCAQGEVCMQSQTLGDGYKFCSGG